MRVTMLAVRKVVAVLSVVIATSTLSMPALCNRMSGIPLPAHRIYLQKQSAENWDCSRPEKVEPDFYLGIRVSVSDDGRLYNPEITHCFVSNQEAAECLEAVLSSAPLPDMGPPRGMMAQEAIGFNRLKSPAFKGEDIRRYLAEHNEPTGNENKWVAVHKIPLSVLKKYPGVFHVEELVTPKNLIQIEVGRKEARNQQGNYSEQPLYVRRMAALYAYWANIFLKQQSLSKEEIGKYAESAPI